MPDQPRHWGRPETLYTVLCRPALPKDTPDVMELTRTIWGGEDYVPHVWKNWLADDQGLLAVAEYGPRVVGLGKLTRLGVNEWWMEGLRVHPQYEGRGIASRLHEYLLGHWEQHCAGVIRLTTASFRKPVHHLCARTGFKQIGDLTPYRAPADPGSPTAFSPLLEEEVDEAYHFAARSETCQLAGGLVEQGWQWATLNLERIRQAARLGRAWWWRGRSGLLLARDEEDENALVAGLIACPLSGLGDLLLDFRRLAASLGYAQADWFAPLGAGLEAILESAGYSRVWDASVFLYEKQHPLRSVG